MSESYATQFDYSFYSQPLPDNKMSSAEQVAYDIIQNLIEKTFNRINKKLKFKQDLKSFSQIKTIKNINEISSVNFLTSLVNIHSISSGGKEPQALISDTFLPISASIDKTNQYKNLLKNNVQIQQQQQTIKKKEKSMNNQQIYIKINQLNIQEEEDGYTKQLRKVQQDNKAKLQKQLKNKLLKDRLGIEDKNNKEKKKQAQIKLSFDYSGEVLKLRVQSKTNLISKLINGRYHEKTLVNKEAFNDKNSTTVQSTLKTKKKNEGSLLKKRQELVYFSQNFSISDEVDVDNGVKFTAQGKTFQKKSKPLNIIQLKKSLSTRKLSKQQFEKIKQNNGSSFKLISKTNPNNQTSRLQTKHKRSKSQMNFGKRFSLPQSIILVNNEQLKDKMLQTIVDNFDYHEPKQNNKPQIIAISQSDLFNIKYLKTRNSQKLNEEQNTGFSSSILPLISKKSTKFPSLPKQRERIKQNKNLIYQIRKQLDQKLKY